MHRLLLVALVAVVAGSAAGLEPGIYIHEFANGQTRRLSGGANPTWFSDGQQLLFTAAQPVHHWQPNRGALYTIRLDGTHKTRLDTAGPRMDYAAARVSADARYIAAFGTVPQPPPRDPEVIEQETLLVFDRQGRLVRGPFAVRGLRTRYAEPAWNQVSWSRTGATIPVGSVDHGPYLLDVATGAKRELYVPTPLRTEPAFVWSRDGSLLGYGRGPVLFYRPGASLEPITTTRLTLFGPAPEADSLIIGDPFTRFSHAQPATTRHVRHDGDRPGSLLFASWPRADLFFASWDEEMHTWLVHRTDGEALHTDIALPAPIHCWSGFDADDGRLAYYGGTYQPRETAFGVFVLRPGEEGEHLADLDAASLRFALPPAFSPDGRHLAFCVPPA